jgi:hypothetical protein
MDKVHTIITDMRAILYYLRTSIDGFIDAYNLEPRALTALVADGFVEVIPSPMEDTDVARLTPAGQKISNL